MGTTCCVPSPFSTTVGGGGGSPSGGTGTILGNVLNEPMTAGPSPLTGPLLALTSTTNIVNEGRFVMLCVVLETGVEPMIDPFKYECMRR